MALSFGDFELDQERRQLLRSGRPVSLEPQAYELLSLLLGRRPRALSRAQIRDVVWPGTFISESTLGVAVNSIRQALDDDAREPRFIRTVHGFGYAFCGEARECLLHAAEANSSAELAPGTVTTTARSEERRRRRWLLAATLAALVAVGGAAWVFSSRGAPSMALPPAKVVPLTNLPGQEEYPALSPDGSRVAFSWEGESGDNWDIYVKQVGTETLLRLTTDPGDDLSPVWSPDGGHIAFARRLESGPAFSTGLRTGSPSRSRISLPTRQWGSSCCR